MEPIDIGTGLSHYWVDEDGNVYWQYQSRFKAMDHQTTDRGYRYIQVGGHRHLVHRLVAKAYLPNPESKKCVNHKDGNKLNNSVSNLEWSTHSENMKHAFRTNLWKPLSGSSSPNSKLSSQQVEKIKARLSVGESAVQIAKDFLVGHTTVYNIKLGKSYVASGLEEKA